MSGASVVMLRPRVNAPVGILSGTYGVELLGPLIGEIDREDVRVIAVPNDFFGGNVSVAGLMVGEDLKRVLEREPEGHRSLIPDVCLSR